MQNGRRASFSWPILYFELVWCKEGRWF